MHCCVYYVFKVYFFRPPELSPEPLQAEKVALVLTVTREQLADARVHETRLLVLDQDGHKSDASEFEEEFELLWLLNPAWF